MRYLVLSDIHSNLTAFEAVLQDAQKQGGFDRIWCLGDVVGYGPDPKECLALLREYDHVCVAGNHDWGSVEKIDISDFNPEARTACLWNGQQLSGEERKYLADLPLTLLGGAFTLVHGSPRDPIWEYLLEPWQALSSFHWFDTRYCLVGHSHVPGYFPLSADGGRCDYHMLPRELPLSGGEQRYIINPGGVGQPRDGDRRASYALYDDAQGLLVHRRVPYDISSVQQRMRKVGLPERLIIRLNYGM